MFLPFSISSFNSGDQLEIGKYEAMVSVYVDYKKRRKMVYSEFIKDGETMPSAIDLAVIEDNGEIFMRDFLKLPDRSWRDSSGKRSDNITELLPSEIFDFPLVSRESAGFHFIGESQ